MHRTKFFRNFTHSNITAPKSQPEHDMTTVASPDPGARAVASLTVSYTDLASSLALSYEDSFPAVLATARMVALMEIASARISHHFSNQDSFPLA